MLARDDPRAEEAQAHAGDGQQDGVRQRASARPAAPAGSPPSAPWRSRAGRRSYRSPDELTPAASPCHEAIVDRDGPSPYNLDDGQAGSLHSRHVGHAGRLAELAAVRSKHAAGRPWRRRCAITTRRRSRRRPRSARPACSITWPISKHELRALPEKPVVIGHSMGGLLALLLCARGLARAGVLLTPAPPAERDRAPAVEPAGLRPHPDELGLVAQAAPRDARRGAVAYFQHDRSRRGRRTSCRLRARFGPRPVRDGAALARRQQGDDDRSPAA